MNRFSAITIGGAKHFYTIPTTNGALPLLGVCCEGRSKDGTFCHSYGINFAKKSSVLGHGIFSHVFRCERGVNLINKTWVENLVPYKGTHRLHPGCYPHKE